LKAELLLRVECAGPEIASDLAKVLEPDNHGLPRGLDLRMERSSGSLTFFASSDEPGDALLAVEGVLRDMELFQEVWLLSAVRESRSRK